MAFFDHLATQRKLRLLTVVGTFSRYVPLLDPRHINASSTESKTTWQSEHKMGPVATIHQRPMPMTPYCVGRNEKLTPHCLTSIATDKVFVPEGMKPLLSSWFGGWMARRVSMATRSELVEAIVERYRLSSRADKQRILDEFVAVTGYHRKHAIRVLRRRAKGSPPARQYPVRYGADVREALIALWEASDRLCSKRLKPLIPILLPALERHGRLDLDSELRDKLLTISAATMDRLLSEVRAVARGGQRRRAGMSSAVRRRFLCVRSGTGTIRRQVMSRWTSWPIPAPLHPAASYRQWC